MNRFFNFILSALLLMFLSPLLLFLIVMVYITMGAPVFFVQERPGLHGKIFRIIKFRTMTEERNRDGQLLPDAGRLTKLGRFLRSMSLDELPELINVLKGEMSLVGPRPLLVEYLDRYSPEEARRHEVRPGITGWAQVNGRNAVNWEERLKMDVWYVDNHNFSLDLKILFLTVVKILSREGISWDGHATMPEFLSTIPKRTESFVRSDLNTSSHVKDKNEND